MTSKGVRDFSLEEIKKAGVRRKSQLKEEDDTLCLDSKCSKSSCKNERKEYYQNILNIRKELTPLIKRANNFHLKN